MDAIPLYLSVEEFSVASSLSVSTVRRRIKDGTLLAFQPGGRKSRLLIPRDALVRPAEASSQLPASKEPAQTPHIAPPATSPSLAGPPPGWMRRSTC